MRLHVKVLNAARQSELRASIERRIRFSLARFGDRIDRAVLTLGDENGPRGGPDQHCTLRVLMPALRPIVVELTDRDPLAAAGRAADRAARRVAEALSRRRELRRGRDSA